MVKKLQMWSVNIGKIVVFSIFGVLSFYLFFNSIFSTCVIWYDTEQTYYIKDFPILLVFGLICMIGIVLFTKRFWNTFFEKKKMIFIVANILWLTLISIFIVNTDIRLVYDQASVYYGIKELITGNYRMWEQGGYYYNYPFQNGLALLYAPIMICFGENTYWVIQIINAVFYFFLAIGMYKIAELYFEERVAICSYLTTLFFFPLWGYVKYLYGNLPGTCLGVWSIYFIVLFERSNSKKALVGSTLCILFATVYKGNFLIYTIAICAVLLMECVRKFELRRLFAIIVICLATWIGLNFPSLLMHHITDCITDEGIPTINCVAMGLRESYVAPGWYNGDAPKWFAENGYSVEKATDSAWDSIFDSIQLFAKEKAYAVRFFNRKSASIWNNPTFEGFAVVIKGNLDGTLSYWMKDVLYSGGIANTILTLLLDVLQTIILFGIILYLIICKEEYHFWKSIPLIAFIGGYILHIFWEAKCQYTIMFYILLFPYAYKGYEKCIQTINELLRDRKKIIELHKKCSTWFFLTMLIMILYINFSDHELWTSTIKLQGGEADYVWLCKEFDYWKDEGFTKEGTIH